MHNGLKIIMKIPSKISEMLITVSVEHLIM